MITIKIATKEDSVELYRLNKDFNGEGYNTILHIENSIVNNPNEIVILAKDNEHGIGFVSGMVLKSFCYIQHEAVILELYVDKDYRRQGVATRLIDAIINEFKHYNVCEIALETSVTNYSAQKCYESYGFIKGDDIRYEMEL